MPIGKKSMFLHLEETIRITRMSANEGVFFFEAKFPDRFNPTKNLKATVQTLLQKIGQGNYEEDAWFFALADGLFLAMQKGMTAEQVVDAFKELQQKRDEMVRNGSKKKKADIEAQLRAQQTSAIFAMQKGQGDDNFALISRVAKGNFQSEMILRRVSQIMEKEELKEILHHMLNEGVTPERVIESFQASGSLDKFKKEIKDKSSDIYDNEEYKKGKKAEQETGIEGTEPEALTLASSAILDQQRMQRNRRQKADEGMSR